MSSEFSANASALGYFYQIRYALLLLIRAGRENPEIELSIENLDDIVFTEKGTPVELIQTKHHIKSTASLSDSSTDLWKTLRIWSTATLRGEISLDDTMLTLVTTGRATDGSAASLLCPDKSLGRDEASALALLRIVAYSSASTTNKPAYDVFLELKDEQQIALVRNIIILDSSPNILDVREQIINELTYSARPEHLESIFERLEGWWINAVVKHLIPSLSGMISQRALMDKIMDLQEQFHLDNLPTDFPTPINVEEGELDEEQRIFVEQLRLILISEPRIRTAISDYYRAFEQRSKWIREELLFVDELESYEHRLIDEWKRRFNIMMEDMTHDPEEERKQREGKSLFNWVDTQANINIRPRFTEPYVMRGSYHMLANDLRVGWHVDFIKRLQHLIGVTSENVL